MIQKTKVIGTRETPEVYEAAQTAARASGITVSEWVSRRVRNSLRRTGRLATQDTQPPQQDTRLTATE